MSERVLAIAGKTDTHCPHCGHPRLWRVFTGSLTSNHPAQYRYHCETCAWTGDIITDSILNSEKGAMKSSFDNILSRVVGTPAKEPQS